MVAMNIPSSLQMHQTEHLATLDVVSTNKTVGH